MSHPIPWLEPDTPFPSQSLAWGAQDPAPGLLAAGATLDPERLLRAYTQGIFPWFSAGQPILWWSPDPRMVLPPECFRLHRSLRKTLRRFRNDTTCEIRIDSAFPAVIKACASSPRGGQPGTWIVPEMIHAYKALNAQGHAHSVETWINGQLAGGLYCVSIGRAVFGESMFAHQTDASKIALAALVCICLQHQVPWIDCQQNTEHLASLGAHEIPRAQFIESLGKTTQAPPINWTFTSAQWDMLNPDGQGMP